MTLHVNDKGTVVEITVTESGAAIDISGATLKEFVFRRPDRTRVTKPASFKTDGKDGKLFYTMILGDLVIAGNYQIQVHLIMPSGEWYLDAQSFSVLDNL